MANTFKIPEVLAPAGSLDKLKIALSYGADAVYVGGQKFGLRAAADNFTNKELREGVDFAHKLNKRVYVVINSFFFDKDFEGLLSFVSYLEEINVDAVIVSDLGVVNFINSNSDIPIHLSTQASCVNASSGKFWKKFGVTRLILGREISIAEAKFIKESTGLEVELFIHGSMCMAYSGNCTISNFTQGRDSNRGGCSHSCRFEYELIGEDENSESFFMSSKDLNGLYALEDFIKAGISSVKIEGRMKGPLYAATVSKVYSESVQEFKKTGKLEKEFLDHQYKELEKFTHRSYFDGSLIKPAGDHSVFNEREHQDNKYHILGTVVDVIHDKFFVVDTKTKILSSTKIEVLTFSKGCLEIQLDELKDLSNDLLDNTRPNQLIKIPYVPGVQKNNLVRYCS